jgi:hypothetical protein
VMGVGATVGTQLRFPWREPQLDRDLDVVVYALLVVEGGAGSSRLLVMSVQP